MGGELYPDGKWIKKDKTPLAVLYFMPGAWIEKSGDNMRFIQ